MFNSGAPNPLEVDATMDGRWAKLMLYSPHNYENKVLRPLIYGFNPDTANFLLGKGDSLNQAIHRKDVLADDRVAGILKPEMNGTEIDMGTFSSLWTFVLLVHMPNNYPGSGALGASGSKTIVYTGHCCPEPVLQSTLWNPTPVINKECELFVHTREVMRENAPRISALGMHGSIDITGNDDFIDGAIGMSARNQELYLMTPSNVLDNFSPDITGGTSTSGACAITNKRSAVQAGLKSPGVHLRQILQGIDATVDGAKNQEYAPHGLESMPSTFTAIEDPDRFKQDFKQQLDNMSGVSNINHGLPADSIFTIADVENLFPNLVVIPQQVSRDANYEVLPQIGVNKRTCYSSFASSAITAIAADVGLSSISFQYQSYDPARRNELDKSSFAVVSENAFLTCPPQDRAMYDLTLRGAVEMFRNKFQSDVVPFIVGVCGHFFIQATYTSNGETLVNLQFLDDNMSTNGTGWFESANRLGSLSSVSVGNEEAFNGNGYALNRFMMTVQGQIGAGAMGRPAFSSPGVDVFGAGECAPTFEQSAPVVNPLSGVFGGGF